MQAEAPTATLRVLLAIKRPLVQLGLQHLLARDLPEAEVRCAQRGRELLGELRSHPPQIVLAEPELAGTAVTSAIQHCPGTRLLLISQREHAGNEATTALRGACAHLGDAASETVLVDAIRFVAACDRSSAAQGACRRCPLRKSCEPAALPLSGREMEVFLRLSEGRAPRDIARELRISIKTVEHYRSQIKSKLGVADSRQLLEFGTLWRRGLSRMPDVAALGHHPEDSPSQRSASVAGARARSKQ